MPFASEFDVVFHRIKETLRSPGLNIICARGDDIRKPNIIDTIIRSIAQSEYIIADLTGLNANVFYELGVAHCFKDSDKVVLLSQDIDDIPFDLRQLRRISYKRSAPGMRALKAELAATFRELAGQQFRFRIGEREVVDLSERLTGCDRSLYELTFECPYLGRDGIKLIVQYQRRTLDPERQPVEPDFFYLELNSEPGQLGPVPWSVHLVDVAEQDALLVLEKDNRSLR
jgi:hypothetical protein